MDSFPSDVLRPVVRSQVYHMLTLGFSYPSNAMFNIYQNGRYIQELYGLFSALPHLYKIALEDADLGERIRMDLSGTSYRDFEIQYAQAFEEGSSEPPCPQYASAYIYGNPSIGVLTELSAIYKQYGVAVVLEQDIPEFPDYLGTELEFMYHLTLKEAWAAQNDDLETVKRYVTGQNQFLERHFMPWFAEFCEKVGAVEGLPFYPQLARLASRILQLDYALVNKTTQAGK